MSKFRFLPAGLKTIASSCAPGRIGISMKRGETYEVDPEWAARLNGMIPGVDGAPCLIPVDDAPEKPAPKADKPAKGPKADKPAIPADHSVETT